MGPNLSSLAAKSETNPPRLAVKPYDPTDSAEYAVRRENRGSQQAFVANAERNKSATLPTETQGHELRVESVCSPDQDERSLTTASSCSDSARREDPH